ncbi:MAG TPA: PQQ-binding-like beta-propeller repeat protein [Streptosporangiaceae bacterium]
MSPRLARRGLLAVVLIAAALLPGHAFGQPARGCTGRCGLAGSIRWARPLPGAWVARAGVDGTVPAQGQAYAAAGSDIAAAGFGMTVTAFTERTGAPLWTTAVSGFPAGSSIVSVRAWPGAVTVGVGYPRRRGTARAEVLLSGRTGRQIRRYPAAAYGGAVAAGQASTVVVGPASVTSYDNATGKEGWSRPTGRVPQAWRADSGELYVTVARGGYLGSSPVTALRRISLKTGAEKLIRPPVGSFAGTLAGAFDGVVLFTGPAGLTAYSGQDGRQLWQLRGALPAGVDEVRGTLYVTSHGALLGVGPDTGTRVAQRPVPGSASLYGIRGGVAFGLDLGARGDAWGYDIAARRVVWTTSALPWPHYFVDLSGIGGSADPAKSTVLLTTCARLGPSSAAGPPGQECLQPELVAVSR